MTGMRSWIVVLVTVLAACSGGGGSSGGGPTRCTHHADCPLQYTCASGSCAPMSQDYKCPAVVSFSPPYDANGTSVGEVLTVTYSEPIRLTSPDVTLRDDVHSSTGTATATLADDERTITLSLVDVPKPFYVDGFTFAGCTDDWGNPCFGAQAWYFPGWLESSPGMVPSSVFLDGITAAMDGSGAPYLGWVEEEGTCGGDLHVHRYDVATGAWSDDSGRLPLDPTLDAKAASLAARGADVAVAWAETGCNPSTIRVAKRSEAGTWTLVGDAVRTGANAIGSIALALDASGGPIVAWSELGQVHAARWGGESWQALGGVVGDPTLFANQTQGGAALALAPGDVPCVAFDRYPPDDFYAHEVYVACWDASTGSWAPLAGGTAWMGSAISFQVSTRGLAFDANGTAWVGWSQTGVVEIASSDGTTWTEPSAVGVHGSGPEVMIDATLGVTLGVGGDLWVGAVALGADGWTRLPDVFSSEYREAEFVAFATGPGGLWAAYDVDGGTWRVIKADQYNR